MVFMEWWFNTFENRIATSDDDLRIINHFLDQNSTTDFSIRDVGFFLDRISENLYIGKYCFCSFLSCEKRLIDIISIHEKNIRSINKNKVYTLFSILEYIFLATEKTMNSWRITVPRFLFEKFPLEIIDITSSSSWGVKIFTTLCYFYRGIKDIEKINETLLNAIPIELFLDKIKLFTQSKEYILLLQSLNNFQRIKTFVTRSKENLIKRMKIIIESRDIYIQMNRIRRMLNTFYLPGKREIKLSILRVEIVYSHFVMKKIILPRITKR